MEFSLVDLARLSENIHFGARVERLGWLILCASLGPVALWWICRRIRTKAQSTTNEDTAESTCDAQTPRLIKVTSIEDDLFALQASRRLGTLQTVLRLSGSLGMLVFAGMIAIDAFAFEPFLMSRTGDLANQHGVQLELNRVDGGLSQGEVRIENVSFARSDDKQLQFDLKFDTLQVRSSFLSAFSLTPKIQEVQLSGLSGTVERPLRKNQVRTNQSAVNAPKAPHSPEDSGTPAPDTGVTAPAFRSIEIKHLRIVDSHVKFIDHNASDGPLTLNFGLNSLDCWPVRTDRVLFDILFRSKSEGTLNEGTYQVTSQVTEDGQLTSWKGTHLPVVLCAEYLKGPFRFLSQGTFDVTATQLIPDDVGKLVQFDCRLTFHQVQFEISANTRPAIAIGAQLLLGYLTQQDTPLDLKLQFELDRKHFDLRTVEDIPQLWSHVRNAAVASITKSIGADTDVIIRISGAESTEEMVDEVTDLAAQALERIRERRQQRRAARGKK